MSLSITYPRHGVDDPVCTTDFIAPVAYDFTSFAATRKSGAALTDDPEYVIKAQVAGETQSYEIFPGEPLHGTWYTEPFSVSDGNSYTITATAYDSEGHVVGTPATSTNVEASDSACD
jgi:hypothetical protein